MDSAALTAWRTAAATSLALRTLMRPDARALAMVGCGALGWPHLTLLAAERAWETVNLFDRVRAQAEALARRARATLGLDVRVARNLASACAQADILVCATSARRPYPGLEHLHVGLTVAAVGADHPHKRELGDGVLEAANLVVDRRAQSVAMGEWHHQPWAARRPAELGEVLLGERRRRRSRDGV